MSVISWIKKTYKHLCMAKCDYCHKTVEMYYDAWNTPAIGSGVYKGDKICIDCIKKLPQKGIIYASLRDKNQPAENS